MSAVVWRATADARASGSALRSAHAASARSTVAVVGLPKGVRVEIEAIVERAV